MADSEGRDASTSSKDSNSSTSMGMGMRSTVGLIRAKYSNVKDITTETLDSWLQGGRNVMLMDCRDDCEFTVSHMAGAQRVDWENADPKALLDGLPPDKPTTVVCYCSVGYRSSAVADKLGKFLHQSSKDKTAGETGQVEVYNLEGSLFKWANEGRPMVDPSGQPTPLCHPYNIIWGQLLQKNLRKS